MSVYVIVKNIDSMDISEDADEIIMFESNEILENLKTNLFTLISENSKKRSENSNRICEISENVDWNKIHDEYEKNNNFTNKEIGEINRLAKESNELKEKLKNIQFGNYKIDLSNYEERDLENTSIYHVEDWIEIKLSKNRIVKNSLKM